MTVTPIGDILAEIQSMRHQKISLSKFIDLRHKLTENIEFNLYGDGSKDEGRKVLAVRDALDKTIVMATSADVVGGDARGLDHMKQAIVLETLAERMQILEGISRSAKGTAIGMKSEMINLLIDPDRIQKFIPSHQNIIKSAASGSVLLARWRFNKIMRGIQDQMKEVVANERTDRMMVTQTPSKR
jgi:hypothetical protein